MSASEMKPFGEYAKYYDLIYQDKDYEGECNFVEQVFRSFALELPKTILDAGCGTGQHAVRLARRGYEVFGIDASEVAIKIARDKARGMAQRMDFSQADIRNFHLNRAFDAAISMFAVMDYLTGNQDIQAALMNIRAHLKKDSLFIFDCWNGLAVLRILPSVTVKSIQDESRSLLRIAEPELDAFQHVCTVNYRMMIMQDNKIVDEVKETHVVRFLFPQEVLHYLEEADFQVLKICPFLDLEGRVDENVWNMAVVARAGRQ